MFKIISIGFPFKTEGVLNINFKDEQTLLDGDIIIINPEVLNIFWKDTKYSTNGNRYLYSHSGSDHTRITFNLRKKEVTTLLDKGKIIIIFLAPVQGVMAEIKDRVEFDIITNYSFLPDDAGTIPRVIFNGHGNSIKLYNPKHLFANYYKAYQNELQYFAYLDISKIDIDDFLLNKSDRPVGFSVKILNGLVVFLPYPPSKFTEEKLLGVLINCAKPYLTKEIKTPTPEWINSFEIPGESNLSSEINLLNKNSRNRETKNRNSEGIR